MPKRFTGGRLSRRLWWYGVVMLISAFGVLAVMQHVIFGLPVEFLLRHFVFVFGFLVLVLLPQWFFLRHNVLLPVKQIVEANWSVAECGEANIPFAPEAMPDHEIGDIMRSRNAMVASLREVEAELHESTRRLEELNEGILNAIPVRVFWKDKNLVYLGCNAVFAHDKGFADPKGIIGKDDYQIGSRDQAELYRGDDQQVIESGCSKLLIEESWTTPEGNTITLLTSKVPLRSSEGEPTGVLGTYIDITERKLAEEALAASQAQLVQAQKMEAVGQLAGGIAHDFNNILQAMLSLATVLRLRAPSPELAKTLAEIEALIRRGAGLTQQLLLFSRREISKTERLDLGELAGTAGVLLRRLIPENIHLTVETTPELLWVEGDAGQLQQVIMNLAVNAKDAMPEGGTLTVRAFGAGGEAVLEVADAGQGMDEQTRARLFEPFFTTKEKGKGTGLGLSVVHGIVTQHGGHIEVESSIGAGSRFRVVLPAVAQPENQAGAAAGVDAELPLGRGEHVLVVEDEEGARKGLVEVLEYLGYNVTAVGSGEEAGVLPADLAPDLLLTDLMLPGVTGSELAAGLRDRWPSLNVILMSGYTEDESVRRGVDKGKVRFLQKPFDMAALAREMRAAIETPAGSSGP